MQTDILLAGVGGQGILSQAYVICNAALEEGLNFKQAEVHGMAQRGGAVQSNLRISSEPISSDLIPKGGCDVLLAVEPLEALRYLEYLGPGGFIVTSINPFVNIPNYPDADSLWKEFEKAGDVIPIDAQSIAKQAGNALSANMVMLGAASTRLPLKVEVLEKWVGNLWKAKGDKVVATNLKAFRYGRRMAEFLTEAAKAGIDLSGLRALTENVPVEHADIKSVPRWVVLLKENPGEKWSEVIAAEIDGR